MERNFKFGRGGLRTAKNELKWSDHAGVETGLARRARLVMATGVVKVPTWLA